MKINSNLCVSDLPFNLNYFLECVNKEIIDTFDRLTNLNSRGKYLPIVIGETPKQFLGLCSNDRILISEKLTFKTFCQVLCHELYHSRENIKIGENKYYSVGTYNIVINDHSEFMARAYEKFSDVMELEINKLYELFLIKRENYLTFIESEKQNLKKDVINFFINKKITLSEIVFEEYLAGCCFISKKRNYLESSYLPSYDDLMEITKRNNCKFTMITYKTVSDFSIVIVPDGEEISLRL